MGGLQPFKAISSGRSIFSILLFHPCRGSPLSIGKLKQGEGFNDAT